MMRVRPRVIGDDHPGVEHPSRVAESLELAHHVVQLVAVLAAHVAGHHPPGAVLGLERAAGGENQLRHVVGERLEPGHRAAESFGEHEVDVAVLGVAEDHGVVEAMPGEQAGEAFARVEQGRHGHDDVLEQRGGARGPGPRHRRIEPLAGVPQARAGRGVGGELGWCRESQPRQRRGRRGAAGAHLLCGFGLVFDQQRRVPVDRDAQQRRVGTGIGPGDPQRRGVHELDRRRGGGDQLGQRPGRAGEVVEHEQAGHRVPQQRHRAHHHRGDERERSLAADDQVGEDVDRACVVEERVQPVAHRVLHRELLLDQPDRCRVAPHPVAESGQTLVQRRFEDPETLVGVGRGRVDHRAARQHHDERVEGVVGVGRGAAGHAAGVVGDHAAERAGDLAGRVGTQLAPVAGQAGVHLADGGARADPDASATVEHLDVTEVATGVDQDPLGARLPAEAGAA